MNQRHPNLNNIISANTNFSYMLLINTKVTVGNVYIYRECIGYDIFIIMICFISHFAKKYGNIAPG
ncbi:hypothetical protein B5631_000216 [Salmonella enterica subsp. enterica serovar Woodinville]|nr:hypothetical protein [Salmonella enterica subsp. enterica serovar Woodinville]EDS4806634.1 hypothetical protein [Salmonella enterica subsp. enterica serovar Woodinville]EDW0129787.1 hypothetical protein [Salmonella enterica subsp. enterica serovar Woodinville]